MIFFKTRAPVEPVHFVHELCASAFDNTERKQSRFVKRLTPVAMIGKATEKGLEEVAIEVLGPYFHKNNGVSRKVSKLLFNSRRMMQHFEVTQHSRGPWVSNVYAWRLS